MASACAGCSHIVAIGGGSTIDTAKAAAIAVRSDVPLESCEGAERVPGTPLPIIAVPTTAGTGSEVTGSCVLTASDGSRKISVRSSKLVPHIAFLDPELLATTPRAVIAASGIDALAHAAEAFLSTRATEVTDALALGALRLISANLVAYYQSPGDTSAASAMGWGACMAGMAFNSARVGLAHAIASAIGPLTHLPHGVCVSLGLPLALRINASAVPESRFARLLEALGVPRSEQDRGFGECAEIHTRRLIDAVGLPQTSLSVDRSFSITDSLLQAVLHSGRLETNPAAISETMLLDMLKELQG